MRERQEKTGNLFERGQWLVVRGDVEDVASSNPERLAPRQGRRSATSPGTRANAQLGQPYRSKLRTTFAQKGVAFLLEQSVYVLASEGRMSRSRTSAPAIAAIRGSRP
jgi:hypothetical protein